MRAFESAERELYLSHILPHLVACPLFESPIIVVLLCSSYAKSAINARRSSKKPSATCLYLAVVDRLHWLGDKVPVGLFIEIVAPSPWHMDILEVGIVWACFEHKDGGIEVFGEASRYYTTRCTSSVGC